MSDPVYEINLQKLTIPNSNWRCIAQTEENYASLALELAATSGRVTSRHPPASSHHLSCARDRVYRVRRLLRGLLLLVLRGSRGGARLGVLLRATRGAAERAAVGPM